MTTKERVLELLESHRGEFISGATMAEELGVSRNAVWKAIKKMEEEGYPIEGKTRVGYQLKEESDFLSIAGIRPFLSKPENVEIHYYDVIDSTNKKAKELAVVAPKHGTVIISNEQTAGRGRYGRHFDSPSAKGIYMSFVLDASKFPFTTPTLITAYAAVQVCQMLETLTQKEPSIKWVNDIFLGDKKMCGILTEGILDFESGQIQWVVVGIGLNVSTQREDFSDTVSEIATSLFENEDQSITRNQLAGALISEMMEGLTDLDEKKLLADYQSRLNMLDKEVIVTQGKQKIIGKSLDVDGEGRLRVKTPEGHIIRIESGEVKVNYR